MEVKEFFRLYSVKFHNETGICGTCALAEGAKCAELFDGCPLPILCNFQKREK